MKYLEIYDSIIENRLLEAFEIIDKIKNRKDDEIIIIRALIYQIQGKHSQAMIELKHADVKDNKILTLAKYTVQLALFYDKRKYDKIDQLMEVSKDLLKEVIEYEKTSVSEKLEITRIWLGYYYSTIAIIRRSKGMIGSALNYYDYSLKIRNKLENKLYKGMTLNDVGSVYHIKGEYISARSFYNQAQEISRLFTSSLLKPIVLINLGRTHYYVGEPIKGLHLLLNGLKILSINRPNKMSQGYLYVSLCYIDIDEKDNAYIYINKLKELTNLNEVPEIELHYKLANAIYLKSHSRFINRAQAQIILSKIVDDSIIDVAITRLSMINLAELLLEEYSIFGETTPFNELHLIISTLYQLAQQQESTVLMIEVMIFQSKIANLRGDSELCLNLIVRAENLAMIHDIDRLVEKTKKVKNGILSEVNTNNSINGIYEKSIKRNALLDYLDDLSNIIKG